MELRQYFAIVWKWKWLVALAVIIAAVSSYLASRAATPLYQATTTLVVGRAIENPNPDFTELYSGQQLAQTYIQLVKREPVLRGALESLGLEFDWSFLAGQVSARLIPQTQLIEITVVDSDPLRAKALADAVAQQLALQAPGASSGSDSEQIAFAQAQLDDLKGKIEEAQDEIDRLQAELDAAISARQIQDLQNQINVLESKLSGWQLTYSQLLTFLEGGDTNALTVFDEARVPRQPFSPNTELNVLTASAIGFALAVAGAFLIEYLDDTVKSPEDVERILGKPILGFVAEMDLSEEFGKDRVYVSEKPRSVIAEAFRGLRTQLEFADEEKPLKSILVTSPGPGEGKTTVAVNLASVLSHSGKRVILIDGDLRRPRIHRMLQIENRNGLSDYLSDQGKLSQIGHLWDSSQKLIAVPSGNLPPNPVELLESNKMTLLLDKLKEYSDILVIDSPPFIVTDPLVLSNKVDGVLLVVQPERSNLKAAKAAYEQLERAGARVVGIVFNRIPRSRAYYYRGYLPYYGGSFHYYQDGKEGKNGKPSARRASKPKTSRKRVQGLFKKSRRS